jgi:threonine aldolase
VAALPIGPSRIRIVLHLDITDGDAADAAQRISKAAMRV